MPMDRNQIVRGLENTAKNVYRDGLKLIQQSIQGLEVIAEKTVEVTKVKVANQKATNQIKHLFMGLGQRVYDSLRSRSKGYLRVTQEINFFISKIKKLQSVIESNLGHLRHLTTVQAASHGATKNTRRKKTIHKIVKKTSKSKRVKR